MKRINKILLVFCFFSFLAIYGGWRFIHSSRFSNEASLKVSDILTKKFGAKLSFSGVDFGIFPPSTIFKNVHIEKNDPQLANVDLLVEELVVSFKYSSFLSSELEIEDLNLKNGELKILLADTKTPEIHWDELSTKDFFLKYSDFYKKSPLHVNIIHVENLKTQIDANKLMIKTFSLAPHRKEIRVKLLAEDIYLDPKLKKIPPLGLTKGEFSLSLVKDLWKINHFLVEDRQNQIEIKSQFFNKEKALHQEGAAQINFDLKSIHRFYPYLSKQFLGLEGDGKLSIDYAGELFNPDATTKIEVNNLKTEWIHFNKIAGLLKKKKNVLQFEKLSALNGNESYELIKSQPFFDLKKMNFLRTRASFNLKNAFSNTFLYSLRDSLTPLKGYLTGKIDVAWDGDKVYFDLREKARFENFQLLSTSQPPILKNGGFDIDEALLSLDKNFKLGIQAKISMPNTKVIATGEISEKGINILLKDSRIDMSAIGPISGVAITGVGPATAEIHGPFDDVKFDFKVDWNNFSIVDLHFGRAQSEFSLSLKDLSINIDKLTGAYNQSIFSAEGELSFGEIGEMDLDIDFKKTNFADAQKMFGLVFNNIKLPVIPEFNFQAKYHIKGGYSLDKLKVTGAIKGTELKVFNEEAEALALNFSLENSLLLFKDVKIKKARGEINAVVSINLANNYTELDGGTQGLRLSDFSFFRKLNIQYDGDVVVDFDGNGIKDNFSSRFKTRVNNPYIENVPASPSNAIFYLNTDDVVINANLLSGKIKLDSNINFKTRQVNLKSAIETTEMREVLGMVAGHNMSDKGISGKIKAQLNTQFNLDTFVIKKFLLDVTQFNLKKADVNVEVDGRYNSVAIDSGIVKKWDMRFIDGDNFFISRARNMSNNSIVFENDFSIKSSVLEFFTGTIEKAVGVMRGSAQLVVDRKMEVSKFEMKGTKNSFKIRSVPGAITDLDFLIIKKGNVYEISHLVGKYGDGDFKVGGSFLFDDLYPQVNIDYKIERATIPLFKRSSLLASSFGTITGTELPYKLNGKVAVLHGEFLDDLSDFTKENKISLDAFKKYLPQKGSGERKSILLLNVSFDILNQIVLKNNLAEVYAKGSGQFSGDVLNPEINARIDIIPSVSKFKFKGHDFLLSQGFAEVRDRSKARSSDIKFVGVAKINNYDVKLDIFGSIEKTQISLSSEPVLAQEDLVALLTLGVTSDMSKNLEAGDLKSVTTVGIGTLLVDQLKINEDLNSMLGLNLSVLPEFKEDESSLVSGKSAVSEGSTSRLKSSTKIVVKKEINKMIDLSVSSTVGGSIEQTQEMNINFNINKNFSIQGVYEVKPAEEENTNAPNSVGADLKYRRSF
ncbi:MAG: translocation/assembly module TamB domain-containing protein [Bacteriovorax sp.]|nr:translocation/assembly module TamB domain-containing protein [Bacteriovorax sp.]